MPRPSSSWSKFLLRLGLGRRGNRAQQRQSRRLKVETLEPRQLLAAVLYFDANRSQPGLGGSGIWDRTSPNWTTSPDGTGPMQAWVDGSQAVFGGAPGTVTLSGSIRAKSITFTTTAYAIQGGTIALDDGDTTVDVMAGSATISSVIVGGRTNSSGASPGQQSSSPALRKAGAGTLTLAGNSAYSGATIVANGTLQLGDTGALGAASVTLGHGTTLDLNGQDLALASLAGNGTVTDSASQPGTSTLTVSPAANVDFSGMIEDGAHRQLALTKTGNGALTLGGNISNTYTGPTVVENGTLLLAKSEGAAAVIGNLQLGVASIVRLPAVQMSQPGQFGPDAVIRLVSASGNATWLVPPDDMTRVGPTSSGSRWTLSVDGQTTGPLAFGGSASSVEAAVAALPTIGAGNVIVSGSGTATDPLAVTLGGAVIQTNSIRCTIQTSQSGGITVTTAQDGEQQRWRIEYTTPPDDGLTTWSLTPPSQRMLQWGGPNTPPDGISPSTNSMIEWAINTFGNVGTVQFANDQTEGTLDIVSDYEGDWVASGFEDGPASATAIPPTNEVQHVLLNRVVGGTWTLSLGDQTTDALAYNANASDVQSALESLSNIGTGSVTVSGGTENSPFVITFGGALAGGNVDQLAADGSGLSYSVNTAPVLSGAGNLDALSKNGLSVGTPVWKLLAGHASDSDGDPLGIAVTAVDNSHGTWQYSTDGGGSWNAFGTPSESTARLLTGDANSRVRFRPAEDWIGFSSISFHAWDQTEGTAGDTADVSTNGDQSAYSAAMAAAGITVSASPTVGIVVHTTAPDVIGWRIHYTTPPDDGQTMWGLLPPSGRLLQYGGANNPPNGISPSINSVIESTINTYGNVGAVQFANDETEGTFDIVGDYGGEWIASGFDGGPATASPLTSGNETREIALCNAARGTWTLSLDDQTTDALAYNATAGDVQSALEALPDIGTGNVTVSGSGTQTDPFVITLAGSLADADVSYLVADGSRLLGAAVTTAQDGGQQLWRIHYTTPPDDGQTTWQLTPPSGRMVEWGGPNNPPPYISPSSNAMVEWAINTYGNVGTVQFANDQIEGSLDIIGDYGGSWIASGFEGGPASATDLSPTNEVQQVALSRATGGTWTLRLDDQTTDALAYNATAGDVQTALEALANIDTGNVTVSGDGTASDPFVITFGGTLAGVNVSPLVADGSGLTLLSAIFSINGPIDEGHSALISFSDPQDSDPNASFHYSYALTEAGLAGSYDDALDGVTKDITLDDSGSRTIYGRIFDNMDGVTTYSTRVMVNNAAPTGTLCNNGPVREGSTATVSFSNIMEPSSADALVVQLLRHPRAQHRQRRPFGHDDLVHRHGLALQVQARRQWGIHHSGENLRHSAAYPQRFLHLDRQNRIGGDVPREQLAPLQAREHCRPLWQRHRGILRRAGPRPIDPYRRHPRRHSADVWPPQPQRQPHPVGHRFYRQDVELHVCQRPPRIRHYSLRREHRGSHYAI